MSSPDILNLDDLGPDMVKKVVLDGESHQATEMTVEGYIAAMRRAKELEATRKDVEVSMESKTQDAVNFLASIWTSIPVERFHRMTLVQLGRMITFTMATPTDIAAGAKAAEGNV